jgi:hypothetical protein
MTSESSPARGMKVRSTVCDAKASVIADQPGQLVRQLRHERRERVGLVRDVGEGVDRGRVTLPAVTAAYPVFAAPSPSIPAAPAPNTGNAVVAPDSPCPDAQRCDIRRPRSAVSAPGPGP